MRPTPRASVSTPVTWKEVERGVAIEDFRIDNVPERRRRRRRPVEAAPGSEGPCAAGEVLLTGQGSENVRDRKTAISPRETTAFGQ